MQKKKNQQDILQEEEYSEEKIALQDTRTYYKALLIKTVWY